MAQGFGLVEELNRDGGIIKSGVFVGKRVEQNDENGLGEEKCDSSDVHRNMRRMSDFG